MKENKYDEAHFFEQYCRMPRSIGGLTAAGEWHEFKKLLPDFTGKRVLDLGCGFGWHCLYASQQGASSVLGIDISEKMLHEAHLKNSAPNIEYRRMPIEDIDFAPNSFDIVLSSLAFHYLESFDQVCRCVKRCLSQGGDFVFSVEHPIFTAEGRQDWVYDESGSPLYWPVDHYFAEGKRKAIFLGEPVIKYHRTLTTYINSLLRNGFVLTGLVEPMPDDSMVSQMPDELRRPMMLLLSARSL